MAGKTDSSLTERLGMNRFSMFADTARVTNVRIIINYYYIKRIKQIYSLWGLPYFLPYSQSHAILLSIVNC